MNSILLSFCAALVINSFAEGKFLLVEIEETEVVSQHAEGGFISDSSLAKEGEKCVSIPECWGAATCRAPQCEEGLECARHASVGRCCGICKKISSIRITSNC